MYTKKDCISAIKKSIEKTENMTYLKNREWLKKHPEYPSATTILKKIGNWNDILRLLGYRAKKIRKKYSKQECINAVKNSIKETNSTLVKHNRKWLEKHPEYPSLNTIIDRYESWSNIVKGLGLERGYTKKECEFAVKKAIEESKSTKLVDNRKWLRKHSEYPSLNTIINKIGKWSDILRLLGYPVNIQEKK